VQDPKNRQKVPFEQLEAGDALGEYRYELTPELVDRHLRATDQQPCAEGRYAPVSLLAADGVNLAEQSWDISSSVHAAQSLSILARPRLGDTLCVRGEVSEKFVRKGRRYVISETSTRDASGVVVARGRTTGVLVYGEGDAEEDGKRPPEPKLPDAPEGTSLGPLLREMTNEKMRLYEAPGDVSLHTDDAIARQVGLPAAIATGTLFMAYVFDLLQQSYGPEAMVGTEVDLKIRLPVFAGDLLETRAERFAGEAGLWLHAVRVTSPNGDAIRGSASVPKR